MFKRIVAAVCCWFLTGPLSASALVVSDDTGNTVTLAKPARRIVSLAPHATELLFAAGAGDAVVGVVSHSDYPPQAAQRTHVGDAENLDVEAIVALQPDLAVAWKSGNRLPQVERLAQLGIPVFQSEPRRLEDIATNLERLGRLAGSVNAAADAAQRFRARHRQLAQRYSRASPVRVFYQIWHQPLMTVNGEHMISHVIRLCGGQNIFADLPLLAAPVDQEAVLEADPEVIIASGAGAQRPQWLDHWRKWPRLSAVKNLQLHVIPPAIIQRQTPRVIEGAQRLCDQLEQARTAQQVQ